MVTMGMLKRAGVMFTMLIILVKCVSMLISLLLALDKVQLINAAVENVIRVATILL